MKKAILPICVLVSSSFLLQAQIIPNAGVEKWATLFDYEEPSGYWFTSNHKSAELPYQPTGSSAVKSVTAFPVPGYNGGKAMRLEVKNNGQNVMPAYMSNTVYHHQMQRAGQPYNGSIPTAVTGYYRSHLPGNDALVAVAFKKNGSVLFSDTFSISGNQSSFTLFSFPVSVSAAPDSVILRIGIGDLETYLASNMFPSANPGNWLELDKIAFNTASGTEPLPAGDFESWVPRAAHIPEGWIDAHFNSGHMQRNVRRTTDRFSGDYAIEFTSFFDSVINEVHAAGATFTMPVAQIAAQKKDSLVFYYKYASPGIDHGNVIVVYSKGQSGYTKFDNITLNPSANFTRMAINLNDRPADATQITVAFKSSDWSYGMGVTGSTLIVDELGLSPDSPSDIRKLYEAKVKIHPNPAQEVLNITEANGLNYTIQDVIGRTVAKGIVTASQVDIKALAQGSYILSINNGKMELATKKFEKQ